MSTAEGREVDKLRRRKTTYILEAVMELWFVSKREQGLHVDKKPVV
jgi:hypothetical protein